MTNPKKTRKIFNIVLAVILAVGVWLYVINVENPTSTATIRDIPVTIEGEDTLAERGLMITDQDQDSVTLKLSGRKKTLMKLSRKNIELTLDVSSVTSEGEHTLNCSYEFPNSMGADSVSITDWDDLRITVTVEKQVSKEIPVRGEFIGTEAEGFLAGTVTTDPSTITIQGPAETLEGISYALASVGGKEINETLVESTNLVLMGTDGTPAERKNVTASTETVEVTVPVSQVVSLPLTIELVDGGGATADTVTVEISPKTITVAAAKEGETLPESISLGTIDLSTVLGDTSYYMPVPLPEGVTIWGSQNAYAAVRLTFDQLTTKQVLVENITYENVPQGYSVEPASKGIYVWVRGRDDLVRGLDAGQIQVTVDLSGASTGDELQRISAQVTLSGDSQEGLGIVGSHYSTALYLKKQ
mgnify:CR=1 FL=1